MVIVDVKSSLVGELRSVEGLIIVSEEVMGSASMGCGSHAPLVILCHELVVS